MESKETGRVEAFSDGVFAIAITLLALELRVPHAEGSKKLVHELIHMWPSYVAFLTSFITIGIIWLNHHRLFALVHRIDSRVLLANMLLLLIVTALSFPTAMVADYLGHDGETVAAVVYAAVFLSLSLAFNLMWFFIKRAKSRVLSVADDDTDVKDINTSFKYGALPYLLAVGVAFAHATTSIILILVLALYWAVKSRPIREREVSD